MKMLIDSNIFYRYGCVVLTFSDVQKWGTCFCGFELNYGIVFATGWKDEI